MNEFNTGGPSTNNPLPPVIPTTPLPNPTPAPTPPPPPSQVLGALAEDRVPITGCVTAVEAILRQPRRLFFQFQQSGSNRLLVILVTIAILCSAVYGLVVGTFSGGQQLWAAPVKIACGLLISALICLPSLYIFSCLSGSEAKLPEIGGLIAGLLTLMTILLVGFAPVAWVFSQSTTSEGLMGSLHIAFWLVATFFGFRFLYAGFAHTNARSRSGLNVWVIIFVMVALQMTSSLRPLLGTSNTFLPDAAHKRFFLGHWLDCLNETPTNYDRPRQGE